MTTFEEPQLSTVPDPGSSEKDSNPRYQFLIKNSLHGTIQDIAINIQLKDLKCIIVKEVRQWKNEN